MARKYSEPIQAVSKKDQAFEELQDLIVKEQHLERQVQKRPAQEGLLQKFTQHLPRLIQRTLAKLEAQTVYQTFKLPGRDYVVSDQRDKSAASQTKSQAETIAEESKRPLEELLVQRGKLVPAKEKGYTNYLGEVSTKPATPEQKAAQERVLEFFSRFEKTLLKRFEQGADIEQPLLNGRFQFLRKTLKQWQDFFARFVQRTVKRKVAAGEIQEMIFRGLVQRQTKVTVISDFSLTNGQFEKYTRHRLTPEAQNFLAMLTGLQPGQRLSKEELRRFLSGDLEYLAIRAAEEEAAFAKAPLKGKFLTTAQAEERVAHDLGLQLGAQLKEKEKVLRGLGGRKRGFPGGGEFDEEGPQFIPWWQYGPFKKHRTPLRWFLFACLVGVVGLILAGLF